MKKIDWEKLLKYIMIGTLLSFGIIAFCMLVAASIKLICMSFGFELGVVIIIFVLLVIGITYWAYKNNILDD